MGGIQISHGEEEMNVVKCETPKHFNVLQKRHWFDKGNHLTEWVVTPVDLTSPNVSVWVMSVHADASVDYVANIAVLRVLEESGVDDKTKEALYKKVDPGVYEFASEWADRALRKVLGLRATQAIIFMPCGSGVDGLQEHINRLREDASREVEQAHPLRDKERCRAVIKARRLCDKADMLAGRRFL